MRIGIFGGTFNPPHLGHVNGAAAAADALMLDKLIVVAAGIPPHKKLPKDTPAGQNRAEMAKIAFRGLNCAEMSDIEIARGGPSFTIDTVGRISEIYPDAELFLLVGTDMFVTLEKWRDWDGLLKSVKFAVFSRSAGETEQIEKYSERLQRFYGVRPEIIKNDTLAISSCELREMLPQRKGRGYLDGEVYAYIIKNRLYGAHPDFDWLREKAYSMLKPKRVRHVQGCETEAVSLATRWGADTDFAREAAILHDITKKLDLEEQLILCKKYGIINDNVEKSDCKLLHAKTGAEVARDIFGMPDEVCMAIRWHTTGRAGMTLLEKIIYLADYIEPTREFDGVEELRRLSYEDLDGAFVLSLEMSIEDMKERGIAPHMKTAEALDYMLTV